MYVDGKFTEHTLAGILGGPVDGTASEYMLAKGMGVVPVPAQLTHVEAATSGVAAITEWNAVSSTRPLKPGPSSSSCLACTIIDSVPVCSAMSSQDSTLREADIDMVSRDTGTSRHSRWP